MNRAPHLDAPGVPHHVMARGIVRQVILRDDSDRDDFVGRLGTIARAGAFHTYAWVCCLTASICSCGQPNDRWRDYWVCGRSQRTERHDEAVATLSAGSSSWNCNERP